MMTAKIRYLDDFSHDFRSAFTIYIKRGRLNVCLLDVDSSRSIHAVKGKLWDYTGIPASRQVNNYCHSSNILWHLMPKTPPLDSPYSIHSAVLYYLSFLDQRKYYKTLNFIMLLSNFCVSAMYFIRNTHAYQGKHRQQSPLLDRNVRNSFTAIPESFPVQPLQSDTQN